VTSLGRHFLPSSWASYSPTLIEIATFAGTFGLFFTLFLLFCRFLPMIAIAEVKGVSGYAKGRPGYEVSGNGEDIPTIHVGDTRSAAGPPRELVPARLQSGGQP